MSFLQSLPASERSSVQVAVRIRPLVEREIAYGTCTNVIGKLITITNPKDKVKKNFDFDYVYNQDSTQLDVFEDIGNKVIQNSYKGYNSCIFAYGQTGSGKSHTMMGDLDDQANLSLNQPTNLNQPANQPSLNQPMPRKLGLIPRISAALFDRQTNHDGIIQGDCSISYRVELSYLEIYNEEVKDLLRKNNPVGGLQVRQHPEYGPYVENLTSVIVEDYSSIKRLIDQGNKERTTASTLMNQHSSRSHAILTLVFTQIITEAHNRVREVVSKLNLVDLAGSERAEHSGVTGVHFKEAININVALSTLGIVINKLSENSKLLGVKSQGKKKPDHIPFRDSVLTWILKESLAGNSKTYMIAAISPSEINYADSLNTLRYAANAKQIVNVVKVNEDPNEKLVKILKDEIESLRRRLNSNSLAATATPAEIQWLREELANKEALLAEKDKTWEQKLHDSEIIHQQQKEQQRIELEQQKEQQRIEHEAEQRRLKDEMLEQEEKHKQELELEKKLAEQRKDEFERTRIVSSAKELQLHYEGRLEKHREQLDAVYSNKLQERVAELRAILQTDLDEKDRIIQELRGAVCTLQEKEKALIVEHQEKEKALIVEHQEKEKALIVEHQEKEKVTLATYQEKEKSLMTTYHDKIEEYSNKIKELHTNYDKKMQQLAEKEQQYQEKDKLHNEKEQQYMERERQYNEKAQMARHTNEKHTSVELETTKSALTKANLEIQKLNTRLSTERITMAKQIQQLQAKILTLEQQ